MYELPYVKVHDFLTWLSLDVHSNCQFVLPSPVLLSSLYFPKDNVLVPPPDSCKMIESTTDGFRFVPF